jgi:riboflavin kinase
VVCGDDARVAAGKPAPHAFTLAAAEAGVPPSSCLVIEDSPAGVAAALAAGMRCVCVPSVPDAPLPAAAADADCRLAVLPSLLEFDPAAYGLPPFADAVAGAVPLAHPAPFASVGGGGVVFLDGTVVRGAGRGSAQLGIPTANLDAATLDAALAGAVMGGIYAAFARVDDGPVYPSAVSVGFNPHFPGQRVKTAEPWILAPEGALLPSFYGARLRLLVVAYIRGERAFASLDALIAAIHGDAAVARAALAHPALAGHAQHPDLVA